jgi:hypothetical protein
MPRHNAQALSSIHTRPVDPRHPATVASFSGVPASCNPFQKSAGESIWQLLFSPNYGWATAKP